MSIYRQSHKNQGQIPNDRSAYPTKPSQIPSNVDREKIARCPDCNKSFHLFSKKSRGWNSKPHERCESCWKKRRDNRRAEASSITQFNDDSIGQVSGVSRSSKSPRGLLHHQVFSKGEWRRAQIMAHPQILLKLSADSQPLSVEVMGIADTGAQSDLWSLEQFITADFSKHDLSPVSLSLHAANRSPIKINGAFHARLEGRSNSGVKVHCRTIIYVSQDVKSLYLSYNTMLELGIINTDFPAVGNFPMTHRPNSHCTDKSVVHSVIDTVGRICGATKNDGAICDCPRRTTIPDKPSVLPFACIPENNGKMKEWLLRRYQSSTFNTYPHQHLPEMSGPPVEIHIKDGAVPVASHKAAPIPLHSSSFFPYTFRVRRTLDPNIRKVLSLAAFKKALLKFKRPIPSLYMEFIILLV